MLRNVVFTMLAAVLVMSIWAGAISANGQEKVTLCHKPGTPAELTLEVSAAAEAAHLAHGDTQGECGEPQSNGCFATNAYDANAIIPDPRGPNVAWGVLGVEFYPGETIHIEVSGSSSGGDALLDAGVSYYDLTQIAYDRVDISSGETGTASIDYVVTADEEDLLYLFANFRGAPSSTTITNVSFSCTPAP